MLPFHSAWQLSWWNLFPSIRNLCCSLYPLPFVWCFFLCMFTCNSRDLNHRDILMSSGSPGHISQDRTLVILLMANWSTGCIYDNSDDLCNQLGNNAENHVSAVWFWDCHKEWPRWMTDLTDALSFTVLNSHMLGNGAESHKWKAMSEGVTLPRFFFNYKLCLSAKTCLFKTNDTCISGNPIMETRPVCSSC